MFFYVVAESLEDALRQLYLIDAIDEDGSITSLGQTMAGKSIFWFFFFFSFPYSSSCHPFETISL